MAAAKKTILLVEDDEDTRFVFSAILNYDGYRVIYAADGRSGVEMARSHLPDLILMDLRLPGMDGFEASEAIRAQDELSTIPIVAVTAASFDHEVLERAARAFHTVLLKPIEPSRLGRCIQDIIGDP